MKAGNFKIIFIAIFLAAALFAVLVFAGVIPLGNDANKNTFQGTITIWGTVNRETIATTLERFNNQNSKSFILRYVAKDPLTFDQELLEALASGTGPDLFFMTDSLAYKYENKIFTIPYATYPLVNFQATYAGAAEVLLTSKGLMAFPLSIDPLMMYYNRSILDTNNIVYPPAYWDEFAEMVSSITKKDDAGQLLESATALGQFSNVPNAKAIISTLFMQTGSKIVNEVSPGFFRATLTGINDNNVLGAMLSFYTDFADPLKETYSWNKSLPSGQDVFSADKLAFYFGHASELQTLVNKNPNQNFGVALMPQIKNSSFKVTKAAVTGVAISASSKNINAAFNVASLLSSGRFASDYATAFGVVPARRDLLAKPPADAYFPIFYSSALYGKSWLDPSPVESDRVFQMMVESVLSNNSVPASAVSSANGRLNSLLLR